MKPTKTQEAVIDAVINQLYYWMVSDALVSPTHYCDIDEWYRVSLKDFLSEKEIEELKTETCNLFQFIRNLAI